MMEWQLYFDEQEPRMYERNIILLSRKWEQYKEHPKFEYLGTILKSMKTKRNNGTNNTGNISQILLYL